MFSRTYTYDNLNRLATWSSPADPSGCTGLSWTYDNWANRTNQTATSATCGGSSLAINTNNQISNSGFGYDAAGNSTTAVTWGPSPYQFDAENRITQFNGGPTYGANYLYDALGRRIEKVLSSSQVHYFYDEDGNVVVETDQNGNWTMDYVYMGGQLAAELTGGQTYFVHNDHLGSTRTITSYQGWVAYDYDYLPYGEQIAGGNFTTHLFSGYERDSESGLDYANARYYNSFIGRFMSPDPAPADAANPQTLNRYAYVVNNPLNATDPSGLFCISLSGGDCSDDGGDGGFGFGIGIGFGWGGDRWGGGGGPSGPSYTPANVGTNPNPPNGDPNSNDPFSGETNGIPNGLRIPGLGLPGILGFPTCNFGACGGMIYNVHLDADGNVIGDYLGEELCTLGPAGVCLYWNPFALKWLPEDNAAKLGNALNEKGIQTLANPCAPALWYGASAAGAVMSTGTAAGGAAFPEIDSTIRYLYALYESLDPDIQTVLKGATVPAVFLAEKAWEGCSSLK